MKLTKQKKGILLLIIGFLMICLIIWANSKSNESDTRHAISKGQTEIIFGEDLKLNQLICSTGDFPEDGSDEFAENILTAEFTNMSDRTLQYATVTVTIDKKTYDFAFSTIPPGESVYAYEVNKAEAPEDLSKYSAQIEYLVYFDEEPSKEEDVLDIQVRDGAIWVKNLSEDTIEKEISVYYKTVSGNHFLGGITYRSRIPAGLITGEEYSVLSGHAYENQSKVMFVTYGN